MKTKSIIIVPDGLADDPGSCANGQTPMSVANTPCLTALSKYSTLGRCRTVPDGFVPGSDVANMSILGYPPKNFFTGRAAIEAAAHDITVRSGHTATRLNFITLSQNECYEQRKMLSFNAGGISNKEAAELLKSLSVFAKKNFPELELRFCESFHHIVISPENIKSDASPPHDIVGQAIGAHLPTDPVILEFVMRGTELLTKHPVNRRRMAHGELPANAIWLWSSGGAMCLESFTGKYNGTRACMISATDVLRGLAKSMDIDCIHVDGANGTLDTNYAGKGRAAITALLYRCYDLAYIHIEAPDAAGHAKRSDDKIKAYEHIDKYIIGPLTNALSQARKPYRLLVLPDHFTSSLDGNHGAAPVPYLLYDSEKDHITYQWHSFCESYVSNLPIVNATTLMPILLGDDNDDNLRHSA